MKTGIEVKTGFMPLAWILNMCTPVIEINGQKNTRKWGVHYFDLAPGDYTVKIYFPYLFIKECGANQVNVRVEEGQTKKVSFEMPPWMMSKGDMRVS